MTHYDLVIIGTGSANSILDQRFADQKIAIVEQGVFGGTCLNVGCIPTKMFVHPADLAHHAATSGRLGVDLKLDRVRWADVRDRIFGRIDPIAAAGKRYRAEHRDNLHVDVYDGVARFTGEKTIEIAAAAGETSTLTADRFVLGAGGRAVVPDIPGLDRVDFHTSDTVMRLPELPERMVILGGGFIAAEFAHVFSAFGVEVTVVVRSGAMLRTHDGEISRRFTELAAQRWDVRLNRHTRAVRQGADGIELDLDHDGTPETATGQVLLVATGRTPNGDLLDAEQTGIRVTDGRIEVDEYQRTDVEGIHALGDVSSLYQLKHVANHEARVVQHNLLHPDDPIASDHRFVPHAVFTHPQIASVGLTEEQAREQGVRHITATHDFGDIAYGWAMEDTTSFVKLLADPEAGLLLGAHILGPQAPTLLQPIIQAMSFGLDVRRMARGQYWIHPAMTEVVENALLKLELD